MLGFLNINDTLYQVFRRVKFTEKLDVSLIKEYWNCDGAFKHNNDGYIYFCRKVDDVEELPIEEVKKRGRKKKNKLNK
jgi:hypothetical protein